MNYSLETDVRKEEEPEILAYLASEALEDHRAMWEPIVSPTEAAHRNEKGPAGEG
jgi:hypothetical protein